LDRRVAF